MAQTPRLNKVIELLEQGKVVFGGGMAWTGNIDEAMAFADMGYDFVIFEMEHEGLLSILNYKLLQLINGVKIIITPKCFYFFSSIAIPQSRGDSYPCFF